MCLHRCLSVLEYVCLCRCVYTGICRFQSARISGEFESSEALCEVVDTGTTLNSESSQKLADDLQNGHVTQSSESHSGERLEV